MMTKLASLDGVMVSFGCIDPVINSSPNAANLWAFVIELGPGRDKAFEDATSFVQTSCAIYGVMTHGTIGGAGPSFLTIIQASPRCRWASWSRRSRKSASRPASCTRTVDFPGPYSRLPDAWQQRLARQSEFDSRKQADPRLRCHRKRSEAASQPNAAWQSQLPGSGDLGVLATNCRAFETEGTRRPVDTRNKVDLDGRVARRMS